MKPIADVAAGVGLDPEDLVLYGKHKAKVPLEVLERPRTGAPAKLVLVSAITPTPAGEGKTVRVAQRDDRAVGVHLLAGAEGEPTDDAYIDGAEDRTRRVESGRRVVIPADGHDVEGGEASPGSRQEVVPGALGPNRWIGRLEDVACDEQRVDGVLLDLLEEEVEERSVLFGSVVVSEGVSEVPVGGVEELQGVPHRAERSPDARWIRAPMASARTVSSETMVALAFARVMPV